jgi:NADPH-dependent glutamate synthase beta subunit-like oxidoreductase
MPLATAWIDGEKIRIEQETTILDACRKAGVYIPVLCSHPDLPPVTDPQPSKAVYQGKVRFENTPRTDPDAGCGLCLVEIEGEAGLARACATAIKDGMRVLTRSERVVEARRRNLSLILADHPHACLVCAKRDGCTLNRCPSNVPEPERCCSLFGNCELQKVSDYVGISPRTPRWRPPAEPMVVEEALFVRDYNLCIGCTRCVRVCRDLVGAGALGFVYDSQGRVRVGSVRQSLEESGCIFCTACVEVCPTGALMDRDVPVGSRKEKRPPCVEACPVHVDVPEYLRLASAGRFKDAWRVVREKLPFPAILGRVCTRPCEDVCRRAALDEPVAVRAVKRYVSGHCGGAGLPVPPETGKRVAVVGAGPAGLAAAYSLRAAGHRVRVLEKFSQPGGMLRYGIPSFRLPRDIVSSEIATVFDSGVEFRPGVVFGESVTFSSLGEEGFDAVFIATGAGRGREPGIPGSDLAGVMFGIDFLHRAADGPPPVLEGRTVVIGGGKTAVDAALTAVRCGSWSVRVVCLEPLDRMPAGLGGPRAASAEGVEILSGYGVSRIIEQHGKAAGVRIAPCLTMFDESGRVSPVLDNHAETLEADRIIIAAGQQPDLSFVSEEPGITLSEGFISVDSESLETGSPGVFAGGDVVGAGGTVIDAVEAGGRAARSIDRFLGGKGGCEDISSAGDRPRSFFMPGAGFKNTGRVPEKERDRDTRRLDFDEVVEGYGAKEARIEASRCLQCDFRLKLGSNPFPPEEIHPFTLEQVEGVPEAPGVYRLYSRGRDVVAIKGTANLKQSLVDMLGAEEGVSWFDFQESALFSTRENELIRDHLRQHGSIPGEDLDDLF